MTPGYSIRARLLLGAALVLVFFMAGAGIAVQRAHADSVRAAHYATLHGTVDLLLSRAEVDASGALEMPTGLGNARLSLPGSGLYASISNPGHDEQWRSPSTVGLQPPFRTRLETGRLVSERLEDGDRAYLATTYAVNWQAGPRPAHLVLSVLEDESEFRHEVAVFARTLWAWLGAAGLLLLLAQLLLLQWGLAPMRRVASEIRRVEGGEQSKIEGRYPTELSGLTDNLNTLIQQERVRQTRYKEALSYLAHSLKTPLAVLHSALDEPARLSETVAQQVRRMDEIVQHQLGRAAAGGATRFAPAVPVTPVLERIREALLKVYADKGLEFTVDCPTDLTWRIDEGDLFEMMGNLMDNAAKWAKQRVRVRAWRAGEHLHLHVDDDGPGFGDTHSVLQLHARGDERVPGHGVGLAVVNDLVTSHHGELKLLRSELGGARIDIALPAP
jgi:two-component system, OmpR family, sensor histidine kinase PhoQ